MTFSTCAVCQKAATLKCNICASACYCSDDCQKQDLALHDLLCSKFKPFTKHNPRPSDMHKLALLFPEKSDLPRLIWVETKAYEEEDEDGNMYFHSMGCSQGLYTHVGKFPRALHIDPNPYKLQIYADDVQEKFEGNQCLSYLTKGYASRDVSAKMISIHDWNGHRAIVGFEEQGRNGEVAKYRDITLSDLRGALSTLSQNMDIFEDSKPNLFIIRDSSNWIKAVKVSCSGDVKFLGKDKYRQVEIRKDHPIFSTYDDISTISQHMGFPLLAKKCAIDPSWSTKVQPSMIWDPLENRDAWGILFNANPCASIAEWGQPAFPLWNNGRDPTVLFAREDKRDVTRYQVEVLSSYCHEVVYWKMLDEDYGWSREERRRIVGRWVTGEAFDAYFSGWAHARFKMGMREWGSRVAGGSGCGVDAFDFWRGSQGVNGDGGDDDSQ